jgi:hypothetical protein
MVRTKGATKCGKLCTECQKQMISCAKKVITTIMHRITEHIYTHWQDTYLSVGDTLSRAILIGGTLSVLITPIGSGAVDEIGSLIVNLGIFTGDGIARGVSPEKSNTLGTNCSHAFIIAQHESINYLIQSTESSTVFKFK